MRYILSVLLILASISGALAEKRVALVIGNDRYATLPDLANATNDARAMAAKLEELGFDVIVGLNASERRMGRGMVWTAGSGMMSGDFRGIRGGPQTGGIK